MLPQAMTSHHPAQRGSVSPLERRNHPKMIQNDISSSLRNIDNAINLTSCALNSLFIHNFNNSYIHTTYIYIFIYKSWLLWYIYISINHSLFIL